MSLKHFTFPIVMFISLSLGKPSSLMAHDAHGAANLGVTVEELANSSNEWDGHMLPSYPSGKPEIKVLRIKIPANVTLPWHYHPVINAAVVVKGTLELVLESGLKRTFGPGKALIEVVNTVHSGKAIGSTDVEVLVFYAGEVGQSTTVLVKD